MIFTYTDCFIKSPKMRGKKLSSCLPTFFNFDHDFVKMHTVLRGI